MITTKANPVVLIRKALEGTGVTIDIASFDKAELYCYRNNIEVTGVICGSTYEVTTELAKYFSGYFTMKGQVMYLYIDYGEEHTKNYRKAIREAIDQAMKEAMVALMKYKGVSER